MSVEALNEALGVDIGPMDRVSITVADPDIIRSWSKGEVKKLEEFEIPVGFDEDTGGEGSNSLGKVQIDPISIQT